jgi:hypothetical protein
MRQKLMRRLFEGGSAGVAGTLAIQNAMKVQKKVAPESMPPMRQDPASFMLGQAKRLMPAEKRGAVPAKVEKIAGKGLSFGYGMTFGLLYAALRRRPRNVVVEGALLGIAAWAAGYLGWLPATGLTPKRRELTLKQIAGPVATHLTYGIATVAAYDRAVAHAA